MHVSPVILWALCFAVLLGDTFRILMMEINFLIFFCEINFKTTFKQYLRKKFIFFKIETLGMKGLNQ